MSKKISVSKAIREGLLEEMRRDDKMFIMGEDMALETLSCTFAVDDQGRLTENSITSSTPPSPRRGSWAWPWAPPCGACTPWWS